MDLGLDKFLPSSESDSNGAWIRLCLLNLSHRSKNQRWEVTGVKVEGHLGFHFSYENGSWTGKLRKSTDRTLFT